MIDRFIQITRAVIEEDGFDGYLPTLLLPQQNEVLVLDDLPDEVDIGQAALDWAGAIAGQEQDYFLAFKLDDSHFKVIARLDGQTSEQVCLA